MTRLKTLALLGLATTAMTVTPVLARRRDRDNNPPGWRGGPCVSPDRYGSCR